jgi:hypothetical protein
VATEFAPIMGMLTAIIGTTGPGLPHRYIAMIPAGLRPGRDPLPGQAPTEELLLQVAENTPVKA